MGKTLRQLPEGQDFGPEHFGSANFGFSGSSEAPHAPTVVIIGVGGKDKGEKPSGGGRRSAKAPRSERAPKSAGDAAAMVEEHEDGSQTFHHSDGRRERRYADGGRAISHPDGRVETCYADGGHAITFPSGMTTHHHADGRIEHRHPDGRIVTQMPDGSMEEHDSSEVAHRARGGRAKPAGDDKAQDAALVRKGVEQHEDQLHDGKRSTLSLARGGPVRTRIPRAMVPRAAKIRSPIGIKGADSVGKGPKNPLMATTPRNDMPGGRLPLGVEPSAEPDVAGDDQTDTQGMRRGGRVKSRA